MRTAVDTPATLIPEDELGKGVVMLRGGASKKATKVLVPYVDNASLYKLLGPSTYRAETTRGTSSGMDFPFPDQRPLSQERTTAHRERVLETIELLADTLDEQTLIRLIHQLPRIREDEDEKDEEPESEPPTLLERGIDAYQKGHTSLSKLAAALDISVWEARKLMPKVEAELKRREA